MERKKTKVFLFASNFGKESNEKYINFYKPQPGDAKYMMLGSSYQRLDAPIRFRIDNSGSSPTFNDVVNCPYLSFTNEGEQTYYAFITDCKYINDKVVEISFKIDPFTTYLNGTISSNTRMLIDRESGIKSVPDPSLQFKANQFLRQVDYQAQGNKYNYQKDVILLYVKNTNSRFNHADADDPNNDDPSYNMYEMIGSVPHLAEGSELKDSAKNLKFLYNDDDGPVVDNNAIDDLVGDDSEMRNSVFNHYNSLYSPAKKIHGHNFGYSIYAITNITNEDNIISNIITNDLFYGGDGCNIIGAEYRHILYPFNGTRIQDNLYKLSNEDRRRMSQPFKLSLDDFSFPDGVPEGLKQSPYYERIFVSNNGSSVYHFNPSASPTNADGNDSLLKELTIYESPEKGSPIVYMFDSTDTNGGHQFYVDNTDRTIPIVADPTIDYVARNAVLYQSSIERDLNSLATRIDQSYTHYKLNKRFNRSIYNKQDLPKLKNNLKAAKTNLNNTLSTNQTNLKNSQTTSAQTLDATRDTDIDNQARSLSTSLTNLGKSNSVQKSNQSRSLLAESNNLAATNTTKTSNLNRTISASKNALDLDNKTSTNSINNSMNIALYGAKNDRNNSLGSRTINEKYEGYSVYRNASKYEKYLLIDQELSAEQFKINWKANKEVLSTTLGIGAIGSGLAAIAKGFEQLVVAMIGGAVSATASIAAFDIKYDAARKLWWREWHNDPWQEDGGGNPRLGYERRGLFREHHVRPGVDQSFMRSKDYPGGTIPSDNIGADVYSEPGSRAKKIFVDESIMAAEYYDKYGKSASPHYSGSVKELIENTYKHAHRRVNYNRESELALNKIKISRSENKFNTNSKAQKTNLTHSNNNEVKNLDRSQSSQRNNLKDSLNTAYDNLDRSNAISKKNLNSSYETKVSNNDISLQTAWINMNNDIKRQRSNFDTSYDADITASNYDFIKSIVSIEQSYASAIIDDIYSFIISLETKYSPFSEFWANVYNLANNSGLVITSSNFWGQVVAGLNQFRIYDIGINARELRYCINYINRYGSYSGLAKYRIVLAPDSYIKTRDVQISAENIPNWAANEISEKLNEGVYVRNYD